MRGTTTTVSSANDRHCIILIHNSFQNGKLHRTRQNNRRKGSCETEFTSTPNKLAWRFNGRGIHLCSIMNDIRVRRRQGSRIDDMCLERNVHDCRDFHRERESCRETSLVVRVDRAIALSRAVNKRHVHTHSLLRRSWSDAPNYCDGVAISPWVGLQCDFASNLGCDNGLNPADEPGSRSGREVVAGLRSIIRPWQIALHPDIGDFGLEVLDLAKRNDEEFKRLFGQRFEVEPATREVDIEALGNIFAGYPYQGALVERISDRNEELDGLRHGVRCWEEGEDVLLRFVIGKTDFSCLWDYSDLQACVLANRWVLVCCCYDIPTCWNGEGDSLHRSPVSRVTDTWWGVDVECCNDVAGGRCPRVVNPRAEMVDPANLRRIPSTDWIPCAIMTVVGSIGGKWWSVNPDVGSRVIRAPRLDPQVANVFGLACRRVINQMNSLLTVPSMDRVTRTPPSLPAGTGIEGSNICVVVPCICLTSM